MYWGMITIALIFLYICMEGGFVVALILFGIGFAAIMFLPDSKPVITETEKKQGRNSTVTHHKHTGGYDYMNDWDFEDDIEVEEWDNSWKTGALPRSVSPYYDIDDPYEREALEFVDMHEFWDNHFDD